MATLIQNGTVITGAVSKSKNIPYDNTSSSGLTATNIQDAIDELSTKSATVFSGSSEPSSSLGKDGDIYIKLS